MNKLFSILILFLVLMYLPSSSYGIVKFYTNEELMQKSNLVVSGKVIKSQRIEVVNNLCGEKVERFQATILIDKILKGKLEEKKVLVEYCGNNPRLEPDARDRQLELGLKGTAYLKKLLNGHYEIFGGWLGWKI